MNNFFTFFAGLVLTLSTVNAQNYEGEPPASLPIDSIASLTSFAHANTKMGLKAVWSEGTLYENDHKVEWLVTGNGSTDVLKKLAPLSFSYKMYDVTKQTFAWAYLADQNGEVMFISTGQQVDLTEQPGGGCKLVSWFCVSISSSQFRFQTSTTLGSISQMKMVNIGPLL